MITPISDKENPIPSFRLNSYLILSFSLLSILLFLTSCKNKTEISSPPSSPKPAKVVASFTHSYLNKPDSLLDHNNIDSAIFYYKQATLLFGKENNYTGQVKALYNIGYSFGLQEERDSAYSYLKKAETIALDKLGSHHLETGLVFYHIGDYYKATNEPGFARNYYLNSLNLIIENSGLYHDRVAYMYTNIGGLYYFSFKNMLQAELYYKKAMEIREAIDDSLSPEIANAHYNLAITYREKGDYDKAYNHSIKAYEIFKKKPDLTLQNANCLNNMANIYHDKMEPNKSIPLYKKAIESAKNGSHDGKLPTYYNNVASCFLELSRPDSAMFFTNLAFEYSNGLSDSVNLSECYSNYGMIFQQKKDYYAALHNYRQCLDIRHKYRKGEHSDIALASKSIGNLYQELKNYDSALFHYQRALTNLLNCPLKDLYKNPPDSSLFNHLDLIEIFYEKAITLEKKFKEEGGDLALLNTAIDCHRLVDQVLRLNRKSYKREASKLFLGKVNKKNYDNAIDCAYILFNKTRRSIYQDMAFDFFERSKSVILWEYLSEVEKSYHTVIPDSLAEEERRLKLGLSMDEFELRKEKEKAEPDIKTIERVNSNLLQEERKLEKLKQYLNEKFPDYYNIHYERKLSNLKTIRRKLKDEEQMISYYWGENYIYALGITKDKVKLTRFEKTSQFKNQLALFLEEVSRNSFSASNVQELKKYNEFKYSANALFNKLCSPVLADLRAKKKVIIVPDDTLCKLPFEALITKNAYSGGVNYKELSYFIKEAIISYSFNVNLCFSNNRIINGNDHLKILFLGNSIDNKKQLYAANAINKPLPSSSLLNQLAKQTGGTFLLATEDNFRNNIKNYNVIHLNLHTVADEEDSLSKALVFFKDGRNLNDTWKLKPYELYNFDLKNKLIVLAACETGTGKNNTGEGVYSIARGFACAGGNSLVTSLWEINDLSSSRIFNEFYSKSFSGAGLDEALFYAKNKYFERCDAITAHPSHWAGLILIGDPQPIKSTQKFYLYWITGALFFLFVTGLFLKLALKKREGILLK